MRAKFSAELLATGDGAEMASIMRACVHCGFCNATCPTYQLQGDELDGPRGRIYLIKSMLEDGPTGQSTQTHLDRCLTCRACETTCPSGVRYSRLLELARPLVEENVPRGRFDRLQRWMIRRIVPHPRRFAFLMSVARMFKWSLPARLRELVPTLEPRIEAPRADIHARKMVLLDGCVQEAAAPNINSAAREIFDRLGMELLSFRTSGCCGAVPYHLGEVAEAQACARKNIDSWWAAIEAGAEAVMATSTGCAMMLKEYAELLATDPAYADRARRISDLVRDPAEMIDTQELARAYQVSSPSPIAFHAPCTMQHGLKINSRAEACLTAVGFELTQVPDAHLCCGSAGTYSLLQAGLAEQLLDRKLAALQSNAPAAIASANIGCLMHLKRRAGPAVMHWLEMIRPHRVGP